MVIWYDFWVVWITSEFWIFKKIFSIQKYAVMTLNKQFANYEFIFKFFFFFFFIHSQTRLICLPNVLRHHLNIFCHIPLIWESPSTPSAKLRGWVWGNNSPMMSPRKEGGKLVPHGMYLENLSATFTALEWALKSCGAWYLHFPSFEIL